MEVEDDSSRAVLVENTELTEDAELLGATSVDINAKACVKLAQDFLSSCQTALEPVALESLKITQGSCAWREFIPASANRSGGAIVMRVGEALPLTRENGAVWSDGVQRSLAACHAAGYCHCDIRPGNVVDFGADGVQLIDHDCAVETGSPVIFAGGGQYDMRPWSLRKCGPKSIVHEWNVGLDKEMVTSCLIKILCG